MTLFAGKNKPLHNALFVGLPRARYDAIDIILRVWQGPVLLIRSHELDAALPVEQTDRGVLIESHPLDSVPDVPVQDGTLVIVAAGENMLEAGIPDVVVDALSRDEVLVMIGANHPLPQLKRWNIVTTPQFGLSEARGIAS